MKPALVLVSILVLSIAIQNTCPFGMAGKTGFTASYIYHCPLKKGRTDRANENSSRKALQHSGPAYTFMASGRFHLTEKPAIQIWKHLYKTTPYKNILSDPPLKPPRIV